MPASLVAPYMSRYTPYTILESTHYPLYIAERTQALPEQENQEYGVRVEVYRPILSDPRNGREAELHILWRSYWQNYLLDGYGPVSPQHTESDVTNGAALPQVFTSIDGIRHEAVKIVQEIERAYRLLQSDTPLDNLMEAAVSGEWLSPLLAIRHPACTEEVEIAYFLATGREAKKAYRGSSGGREAFILEYLQLDSRNIRAEYLPAGETI